MAGEAGKEATVVGSVLEVESRGFHAVGHRKNDMSGSSNLGDFLSRIFFFKVYINRKMKVKFRAVMGRLVL